MSLPLTVSCFCKIHIGFTFLVPAHPGSLGQRAVKRVCHWLHLITPATGSLLSSFTDWLCGKPVPLQTRCMLPLLICVMLVRRVWCRHARWRRVCSATFATCLTYTTLMTVQCSRRPVVHCRPTIRHLTTPVGHTAASVKVASSYCWAVVRYNRRCYFNVRLKAYKVSFIYRTDPTTKKCTNTHSAYVYLHLCASFLWSFLKWIHRETRW